MEYKSFLVLTILSVLINFINSQSDPIINLNSFEVKNFTYKGDFPYLFIIIPYQNLKLGKKITVKINTKDDISFTKIYGHSVPNDASSFSYQNLLSLSFNYDTDCLSRRTYIFNNYTYIYTTTHEEMFTFDNFLIERVPINADKKEYTYSIWLVKSSFFEELILTLSIGVFVTILSIFFCCCCCPCCPIFLCLLARKRQKEKENEVFDKQPLLPGNVTVTYVTQPVVVASPQIVTVPVPVPAPVPPQGAVTYVQKPTMPPTPQAPYTQPTPYPPPVQTVVQPIPPPAQPPVQTVVQPVITESLANPNDPNYDYPQNI